MADVDERTAMAWLCRQLPTLYAAADRDGWRDLLDKEVSKLRGGGSALRASRRLGLPVEPDRQRSPDGGFPSLADLGLDPVTVEGDYVCPSGRCGRRAQPDQDGRQPVCAVDGAPMPLQARP